MFTGPESLTAKERAIVEEAHRRNFLLLKGSQERKHWIRIAWVGEKVSRGECAITIEPTGRKFAQFSVQLPRTKRISPIGYNEIHEWIHSMAGKNFDVRFDSQHFSAHPVQLEQACQRAPELIPIIERDQSDARKLELAQMFPGCAEGMAKCVNNEGMEHELELDEVVYVRQIPNMLGHCVVLRNNKPPLVGYHLDRFQVLYDYD